MIDDLAVESFYVELLMMRTGGDDRAFLIVEGHTDCAVLDDHIDNQHCVSVPAHGKERAAAAIVEVDRNGDEGIFAVLDKDWVNLLDSHPKLPESLVAYTDHYDLDASVFFSDRMVSRQAASFCSDKFRLGDAGCSEAEVVQVCVELALPIGILRFISERNGTGLALRNFPLDAVVSGGFPYRVDGEKLVKIASDKAGKIVDVSQFVAELNEVSKCLKNRMRYCSGHDLFKALAIVLKRRWGGKVGAHQLEQAARAAMGRDRISVLFFFERMRLIAERAGYRVWKTKASQYQLTP
ncbi:hypothetical protein [Streptomyces sp. ST2-7A]|uniref:hypothetical protein n=1 Tax=Streptomyces sp. ST2-7A TaxID=2907214 RepID=UPI001F3B37A3|nr:hypothetical protein [Streptomyces sp. ST2-7A]MCE7079001.1 hypothetical protein [Streptomyces sp. ST2-7A]